MSATHDPESIDTILARKRSRTVDERALQTLFSQARTARGFIDAPVPRELLERIVEFAQFGPTQSNTLPLRIVFVQSPAAKERLRPLLSRGNLEKTMAAPVTAIVAADLHFYEKLPGGSPAPPKPPIDTEMATRSALMSATLQGAYVILAARALGLDVGPMAGFDRVKTDAEFFPDGTLRSLWLMNLGYADDTKTPPRAARFTFAQIATIL